MEKEKFSIIIGEKNAKNVKTNSVLQKETQIIEKYKNINEQEPKEERINYSKIEQKTRFLHRTYGISVKYNEQKSIQYLLEVKCEGFKNEVYTYVLVRKRFFKDGKALEGVMEELAEHSASCIYPLKIHVNKQGEFIGVVNQKEIEKRWYNLKPELLKRYSGSPFKEFCNNIEKAISNNEFIFSGLQNDVVYNILFTKLYFNYSEALTMPITKEFKWFSGMDKIIFKGEQKLSPFIKLNKRLFVTYKGKMQSVTAINDGEIDVVYQLNSTDFTLLRLDGLFKYTIDKQIKKIEFKAIWQENLDQTEQQKINDKKRRGVYITPGSQWWQFWK